MNDPIERQEVMDAIYKCTDIYVNNLPIMIYKAELYKAISELPSAQPQYEELTPVEAASAFASGSTMSGWYWLDDMIRLKQMGYAICRKKEDL